MTTQTAQTISFVLRLIAIAIGGTVAVLGLFGSAGYIISRLVSSSVDINSSTISAIFVIGAGLGTVLAWQGIDSFYKRPSKPFWLPPLRVLFPLYILVLVLGQSIIYFNILPVVIFPPFHILAATLPPIAVLAFAGNSFKAVGIKISWREIIATLSVGAFISTLSALVLEAVIGIILFLIILLFTAFTANGRMIIQQLTFILQDQTWLENPNIQDIISLPPVYITLIIIFVIIAPMIEELVKPIGLFLMSYRTPSKTASSQAQIFLWGLAGGAGFAAVENLFNTLNSFEMWVIVLLARVGASAMHCLGSGLIALGWHKFLTERSIWKLAGSYLLSVTIHSAWNGAVIVIVGVSIVIADSATELANSIGVMVVFFAISFIIILASSVVTAIIIITRRLVNSHLKQEKYNEQHNEKNLLPVTTGLD